MEASVNIGFDKLRKNAEGLIAVKLRVTHNRQSKYYSVKKLLSNNDWNYVDSPETLKKIMKATKGRDKDIRLNYEYVLKKATEAIQALHFFSFPAFERKFLNKASDWSFVANAFNDYIEALKNDERIGYAISMQSTLTTIKFFTENKPFPKGVQAKDHANFKKYKDLKFSDITPQWLKGFEKYLIKNEKSTSTIGVYARNIRVLFNEAIKKHDINVPYPFNEYKPRTGTNNKRALSPEQLKAFASYKPLPGSPEAFAHDMFLFSFYAQGMNLTDIFRLKYKNIKGDFVEFVRFKTRAKTNETMLSFAFEPELQEIINRWGNKAISSEIYIFPVLSGVTKEKDAHRLITQKTKQINKHLKRIAENVGFEPVIYNNFSTYFARHTYATMSVKLGQSIEFLREALGHASTATTQKYISSFGVDAKRKAAQDLRNAINQ